MVWSEHPRLRVDICRDGEASAAVRLAGDIDITSVEAARRAVAQAQAGTRRLALDLSRVTFCDVAGARFLLAVRDQAGSAGMDLVVRYPNRSVRHVLELTDQLPVLGPGEGDGSGPPPAPGPAVVRAFEMTVAQAIEAAGADTGNAQLVDPATGALRIVAQHGFGRSFLDFFEIVHDDESACGAALAAGRPVWVPEVASSAIFAGTPALDVMLDAGSQAVASVPVRGRDGSTVGMISVHYHQPTAWTGQQKRQLTAVVAAAGYQLSA
jgi:anti-anti-sigma factor